MSSDDNCDPSPPRKRRKFHPSTTAQPSQPSNGASHPPPNPLPPITNPLPTRPPPVPTRFPIQPLNSFHGVAATIKRPREIAHFSYDDNHEYRDDESGISYYHPPELGTNLCEGFDTFRHYEDKEDPHLDSLLKALASKEKEKGEKFKPDFVTWRGMMTKIMTAPYDNFAEFSMLATLHENTIYIEEDFAAKTAQRASEPARPQNPHLPSHATMTYWGYKFETLSMLPTPTADAESLRARKREIVSNHRQHCSIIQTQIGSNTLILGGEVDGLSRPKPPSSGIDAGAPILWVELKTAEELPQPQHRQHRDILKYERKLLKFWAQSFLLGVEKIIVGFRSKQGVLRGIDEYETGRLAGMVRRGTGCWDGSVCINFAAAFLDHLRQSITEEGVYRITLPKRAGVIEVCKVDGEGRGSIVSKEFLDWRKRFESEREGPTSAGDGEGKVDGVESAAPVKDETTHADDETKKIPSI